MLDYKIVRQLMDTEALYKLALRETKANPQYDKDFQCPGCPVLYSNPVMTGIQEEVILPIIEEVFEKKLAKSYNYIRVYIHNSKLRIHTDRPACEYSVSLCLGYETKEYWPIWIEDTSGAAHEIILKPGDAVFYRGADCRHWRTWFKGVHYVQAFFHFVDVTGPYKDHANDITVVNP